MKSLVLALALTLSAASASAGWTQVTDIEKYKNAIITAFQSHTTPWTCTATRTANGVTTASNDLQIQNLPSVVRTQTQGIWISSDRSQPLMYLKYTSPQGHGELFFHTDASRRMLTKIEVIEGTPNKSMKNTGTIDNPVFEEITIVDPVFRATCQ